MGWISSSREGPLPLLWTPGPGVLEDSDVQMNILYKVSLWAELGTLSLCPPEGWAKHWTAGLPWAMNFQTRRIFHLQCPRSPRHAVATHADANPNSDFLGYYCWLQQMVAHLELVISHGVNREENTRVEKTKIKKKGCFSFTLIFAHFQPHWRSWSPGSDKNRLFFCSS